MSRRAPRVVVVGGGVAGLVIARDLARAGLNVELLEGSRHLGGVVGPLTVQRDPTAEAAGRGRFRTVVVDAGAESFATRSVAVADLLEELHLTSRVVPPSPVGAWVAHDAGAAPLPRSGVLGIPTDLAEIDRVAGRAAVRRARLDRWLPRRVGTGRRGTSVSLGHLVRARLGREVLDRLVAPVAGGVHSTDPMLLDVDAVAPGLRRAVAEHGALMAAAAALRAAAPAGAAVAGIRGGMHHLVTALADEVVGHGGVIRPRARVDAIERVAGTGRSPWRLTLADGATLGAAHVVVATDLPAAGALLAPLLPGVAIPQPSAGAGVSLVTLVLDHPGLNDAPRGTGVLVAPGAGPALGIHAKALTHASAKWDWVRDALPRDHHVVRLSFGRLGDAVDARTTSNDALVAAAIHDVGVLLGVPVEPAQVVGSAVVRFPAGLPYAGVGHAARVRAVREAAHEHPGLHVAGAWIAGTGLASVVADARAVAATLVGQLKNGGGAVAV